jgi:TPR repeat protein
MIDGTADKADTRKVRAANLYAIAAEHGDVRSLMSLGMLPMYTHVDTYI